MIPIPASDRYNSTEIRTRLAQLRQSRGESLRDAGARTGISHTTIARLEAGATEAFGYTLGRIAQGYGVSLRWLLTGEDDSTDLCRLWMQFLGESGARVDQAEAQAVLMMLTRTLAAGVPGREIRTALRVLVEVRGSSATG